MRARSLLLLRTAVRLAGLPFETRDERRKVDAIVVLGAPLRPDGQLSLIGRERVAEGVRCWNEGWAPLLVFTGGAAHSAAEAPVMAQRAHELGVPKEAILIEADSVTTAENALFTAEILRSHRVKSVWVISQPFHLRRGRRLFRLQGFEASARRDPDSVQYQYPNLSWRWVAREYVAWAVHFVSPVH